MRRGGIRLAFDPKAIRTPSQGGRSPRQPGRVGREPQPRAPGRASCSASPRETTSGTSSWQRRPWRREARRSSCRGRRRRPRPGRRREPAGTTVAIPHGQSASSRRGGTRTLSARCQRCPGPRSSAGPREAAALQRSAPRGARSRCLERQAVARAVSDNAGRDHDPADPGPGIAHGNRVGKIARALIEEGELIDRGGTGHRVYGPQDPPFAAIRTGPPALMPISVSVIFHSVPPRPSRESGGTGRRARLRISWPTAVGVRVPPFALRPRSPRTIWDR